MVNSHWENKPDCINCHGQRQHGIASIEYALIASLIAIAVVSGVAAVGNANSLNWATVADKVLAALGV